MTRSRSLGSLALSAGMVAAAAGTVAAADPPGRSASMVHLTSALVAATTTGSGGEDRLNESISLNIARSMDPEQPGTSPGGGDPAP